MMGIGENGRVWKQREGGELVEMTEHLYDSEDLLQGMLARGADQGALTILGDVSNLGQVSPAYDYSGHLFLPEVDAKVQQ